MSTIKGKWVFNAVPQVPDGNEILANITFTSNSQPYTSIRIDSTEELFPNLYYGSTSVCDVWGSGWTNEAYRTVDFGTTEQTVSDTFLTWMQANAVPEAEPTPTDVVTVEYNGAVIASLKAGQSATLPCKDTLMHTDVVVSVPDGMGGSVEEWDGSIEVV